MMCANGMVEWVDVKTAWFATEVLGVVYDGPKLGRSVSTSGEAGPRTDNRNGLQHSRVLKMVNVMCVVGNGDGSRGGEVEFEEPHDPGLVKPARPGTYNRPLILASWPWTASPGSQPWHFLRYSASSTRRIGQNTVKEPEADEAAG